MRKLLNLYQIEYFQWRKSAGQIRQHMIIFLESDDSHKFSEAFSAEHEIRLPVTSHLASTLFAFTTVFSVFSWVSFPQEVVVVLQKQVQQQQANSLMIIIHRSMESEKSIEVAVLVKSSGSSQQLVLNSAYEIVCQSKCFTFNYFFDQNATWKNIYEREGTKIISNAKNGDNSCIFGYGQTSSDSTYTKIDTQNSQGLLQAYPNQIWQIDLYYDNLELELNYYEIYNQQINDLLVERNQEKKAIKQKERVFSMEEGENHQPSKETAKKKSGRSLHEFSLFKIPHLILTSKLQVRIKRSIFSIQQDHKKQRMLPKKDNGGSLRKSLAFLNRVIEKLALFASQYTLHQFSMNQRIPGRKFQDSFFHLKVFFRGLVNHQIGFKAQNIKQKAKVNEYISQKNINNLEGAILKLENKIKELRQTNGECGNYHNIQQQYEQISQLNQKMDKQLHQLQQKHQEKSKKLSEQQQSFNMQEVENQYLQKRYRTLFLRNMIGSFSSPKHNSKTASSRNFQKLQKIRIHELKSELQIEKNYSKQKQYQLKTSVHQEKETTLEVKRIRIIHKIFKAKKLQSELGYLYLCLDKTIKQLEDKLKEPVELIEEFQCGAQTRSISQKEAFIKQQKSLEDKAKQVEDLIHDLAQILGQILEVRNYKRNFIKLKSKPSNQGGIYDLEAFIIHYLSSNQPFHSQTIIQKY